MTPFLIPALLAALVASAGRPAVEHGSLVAAMPVASGWVVCGDKRRTNSIFAGADDETKVFELAPGLVAGMTGLRRVNEGNTTYFDVGDRVKAFARNHRFDGRGEFAEVLAKALADDFVAAVPRRIWPDIETVEARGPSAFTVMLFWVAPAGLPRWSEVAFHLRGGPRFTAASSREAVALRDNLRTIPFGNLAVIDELQHGHRAAFADARMEGDIRRFLLDRYAWRERGAGDAERFGRRIIELTSARLPELEPGASNVGPLADCVVASRVPG